MKFEKWLLCPVCQNKTRLRLREDTILENFPLYCPKCKQETLINVKQMNIFIVKEPDARKNTKRSDAKPSCFYCPDNLP